MIICLALESSEIIVKIWGVAPAAIIIIIIVVSNFILSYVQHGIIRKHYFLKKFNSPEYIDFFLE